MRPRPIQQGEPTTSWTIGRLQAYTTELEMQHAQLLHASIQQFRELATVDRMAASLGGRRRSSRQVLLEAVREVQRLLDDNTAWVVEPGTGQRPRASYRADGHDQPYDELPSEARQLCGRLLAAGADELCWLPAAASRRGPGYLGVPVIAASRVLAVLVFRSDGAGGRTRDEVDRLLEIIARQAAVACENARLIEAMGQMVVEVVAAMSAAIESRDPYTGGHTQRVTAYALALGERLGLDPAALATLRLGALLHDVGKIGVPDAILRKPGRLTPEEFEVIKMHPVIGHEIVSRVPQLAGFSDIVRHHHERYDGRGYPDRLAGADIPLLARLVAVADTFDAMTSSRSYRPATSPQLARQEIRRCLGTQFDPQLGDAFLAMTPTELTEAVERWPNVCPREQREGMMSLIDTLTLSPPHLVA